jgi:hypothetical protein
MPVTIVRTGMQDDDGTGTTGTVINNAWKTEFYNQIDQALAKVPMLTGNNTFTGNQLINGLLTVTGLGSHTFIASGVGQNYVFIRNATAGAANISGLIIGNDVSQTQSSIQTFASTYAPSAPYFFADGTTIYQGGAGGLTLATGVAQPIRFFTNATQRWFIDASTGAWQQGTLGNGNAFAYMSSGGCNWGTPGTGNTPVHYFTNANGVVGSINVSASTTIYNTTSDARLKRDRGIARDTTVLEQTDIHNYDWIVDGRRGRGVFSQEAHAVHPDANTPGTDERDAEGRLVRPWSTDYSKYVPDLIVGWQQHAAALAALRAEIAALKG